MNYHPDFSGTWYADFTKSRLEIGVPEMTKFQIEHKDPVLRITRTHKAKDYEDTFSMELTTDGKEVVYHKETLEVYARCTWQGDSLSFCSRFQIGESEVVNLVTYTLSQDNQELIAEEYYTGPPKNHHNCWVMVRATDERYKER